MRRIAHLLAGAALLAACSGSDDTDEVSTAATDEPGTEATSPTEPDAPSDTSTATTAPPATAVETTDAPAATAPPTTPPPVEPKPLLAGFDDLIELTVGPGAVPNRPVLSWTAVDGADHYGAYVYAPNGELYWAWQGRETNVPLGGAIGDAPGPAAGGGMTWAVIAYDASLLPIGVSVVAPLVD